MFDPEVTAMEPDLIIWRRYLHQTPEVSFEEINTTRWLEQMLREMGVRTLAT